MLCNLTMKENQHGSLKALRQKRATLLTPSYFRRRSENTNFTPIYCIYNKYID